MLPAGPLLALLAAGAIEWETPLECPGSDWLIGRVEAYLGRPLVDEELDAVSVHGYVRSGAGGRFELELELGEDRHRIADHDCRRLVDTAASLLAIVIDPLALARPVTPLEQAVPTIVVPLPTGIEPSVQIVLARAEPDPRAWESSSIVDAEGIDRIVDAPSSRVRGSLAADAGLALGLFPNPAPQVHGRIGLDLHEPGARVGLRVELDGGAAVGGRFRAGDGRELGGDLIAWDLALRPCAVPRWDRFNLRTCVSAGAGQLRGRGVGVIDPQQVAQPWVWAGGDLGVALALHRHDARARISAALFIDFGGGFNLLRPNFVVLDQPDIAYVMPIASGRARLGIELGFF